jgi:Na+/H+ antiporter NhaC
MLNFIARSFEKVFKFCLWLNLIIFTVFGIIVFGRIGGDSVVGLMVAGAIVGCLVGLLLNVLFGGVIAIFLRIDKNLQILTKLADGQPIEQGIEQADN